MTTQARARVLDVGQCSPDHDAIHQLITAHFDANVDRVMFVEEALEAMHRTRYDLVLVNRVIFDDGSDGMELIQRTRADEALADVPIMMVSNYADAQADALDAGAEPGFGKAHLSDPATLEKLGRHLPSRPAPA